MVNKYDGEININTKIETKTMDTQLKNVAGTVKNFSASSLLAFTAVGVGVGVAVDALSGLVKGAIESGDRVDKLSQKIGISNKAFQEWDYTLTQSGIDIAGLQPAMKTLNDLITSASKGSKEAKASFAKLGLSWEQLNSVSPDERLDLVITALQQVEDPVRRSSLAVDLLGRAATELNPLLNTSIEETRRLKTSAHELGLVLSDEQVKAAANAGDAIDDLSKSWKAFKDNIVLTYAPAMTTLFKALTPQEKDVNSLSFFQQQLAGIDAQINKLKKGSENKTFFDILFGKNNDDELKRLEKLKKYYTSLIDVSNKTATAQKANDAKQAASIKKLQEEQAKEETRLKKEQELVDANNKAWEENKNQMERWQIGAESMGTAFESMGTAIVSGTDAWKVFAAGAISAVADVISAMANQLITQSILQIFDSDPSNDSKGYQGLAQAAGLKVIAGMVKATAGKFADGGIVPGTSYSGDKLFAKVNSGEMILNRDQQQNMANLISNNGNNAGLKTSVNINNYAGVNVSASQDKQNIDILITKKINQAVGTNKFQRAMAGTYGLSAKGIKRG